MARSKEEKAVTVQAEGNPAHSALERRLRCCLACKKPPGRKVEALNVVTFSA